MLCVLADLAAYAAAMRLGLGSVAVSKAASYLTGVAVGFVLNKRWTFRSRRIGLREPVVYLAVYAVTLGVNVGCNDLALRILGAEARTIAFLGATGVTTVLNFLGMRLLAFRLGIDDRRREATATPGQHARLAA